MVLCIPLSRAKLASVWYNCPSIRRTSFIYFYFSAHLSVINPFNFWDWNNLYFTFILRDILGGYRILGWQSSPFLPIHLVAPLSSGFHSFDNSVVIPIFVLWIYCLFFSWLLLNLFLYLQFSAIWFWCV